MSWIEDRAGGEEGSELGGGGGVEGSFCVHDPLFFLLDVLCAVGSTTHTRRLFQPIRKVDHPQQSRKQHTTLARVSFLPLDLLSSGSSVLLHERLGPLHVQLDSGGESILEVAEGVALRRKHLKRSTVIIGQTHARGSGVI